MTRDVRDERAFADEAPDAYRHFDARDDGWDPDAQPATDAAPADAAPAE